MGVRPSAADAIVVLGGGVTPNGLPTLSTQHRLNTALELFENGAANHLIFSGRWSSHLSQEPACTEAQAMRTEALRRGIAAAALHTEDHSMTSLGNAYHCKVDILEPCNLRNIILVTSPSHALRGGYMFNHILGPDYSLEIKTTHEPNLADLQEFAGYLAIQEELRDIAPGDHHAIAARVLGYEAYRTYQPPIAV